MGTVSAGILGREPEGRSQLSTASVRRYGSGGSSPIVEGRLCIRNVNVDSLTVIVIRMSTARTLLS
jgi:hypothetical protein